MDWGLGNYERIAAQLLGAANVALDQAAPRSGEHVVDVGCGTGNAALLAAERGARVTGIDPAQRLLDVAGAQAGRRGLEATFMRGEAGALALADAAADVVLSVFGVIFAPDASAAASEIARVTAPDGRIVLCAWIPDGALFEVARLRREAVSATAGTALGPPSLEWHDADALRGMFGPLGFTVDLYEERLAFTADSPEDFVESEFRDQPLWVAGRAALEPGGKMETLRAEALHILEAANEQPDGFRVTSRYVVTTLHRT
jgi:SAM-dependent methyltransferase